MDSVKRIVSGLIGMPLVIIVLIFGNNLVVDIVLAIIAFICMNEYINAISKIAKPIKWISYLSCFSLVFLHVIPQERITTALMFLSPVVLIILFAHVVLTEMKITFKDIAYTLFGIVYIIFLISFLSLINGMENGKILIWYAIMAAWGTDIFAYFVGKNLGKHKFSKVSPKKSIEGCIGGTIGAIVIMLIYTYFINQYLFVDYSYLSVIGIGIVLSIVGQIGDFAASSIKRTVEIKDYSNLIPGHGGMLDRVDSLIFLAPVAYICFLL